MTGCGRAEREHILVLAHQTEAMARSKKLPSLKKLIEGKPVARQGTDDAVFHMLEKQAERGMVKIKERTLDG